MKPTRLCAGLICLLTALLLPATPHAATPGASLGVTTPGGERVLPLAPRSDDTVVLLFFIAVECPISNRYAPRLAALHDEFAPAGVECWFVYADDLAQPAAVTSHAATLGLRGRIVLDPHFALADATGVTVTPEAALLMVPRDGSAPRLLYRGRIDDQYHDFNRYRPAPTGSELRDILTAVCRGDLPTTPVLTRAVGCYLPSPQPAAPASAHHH